MLITSSSGISERRLRDEACSLAFCHDILDFSHWTNIDAVCSTVRRNINIAFRLRLAGQV